MKVKDKYQPYPQLSIGEYVRAIGYVYIVAGVARSTMAMVNINTGGRLGDPVVVQDYPKISEHEAKHLLAGEWDNAEIITREEAFKL